SNGQYGLFNVTLPAGTWYIGASYSGAGSASIFDEISTISDPGASFIGNVPVAVSGNAGAWNAQGFTITGSPDVWIETEAYGGLFMIMNDGQFQAFQSANSNGYAGGSITYTNAFNPATEVEQQLSLPAGHWNLLWVNNT